MLKGNHTKKKLTKCDIALLMLTVFVLFMNLMAIMYQLYGTEKGKIISTLNIVILTTEFVLFRHSKTNKIVND